MALLLVSLFSLAVAAEPIDWKKAPSVSKQQLVPKSNNKLEDDKITNWYKTLALQLGCYDTDNGVNALKKGSVYLEIPNKQVKVFEDTCQVDKITNKYSVVDFVCNKLPGQAKTDTIFSAEKNIIVCKNAICKQGACQPQSCSDGIKNQDETAVDCGGKACLACASCTDNIKNQGELSVDCDGPCAKACQAAPTCTDNIKNQDETGVDCGGVCSITCDLCTHNLTKIGQTNKWYGGIFALSPTDIFIGEGNGIYHYDGYKFEAVPVEISVSDTNDAVSPAGSLPAFSPRAFWGDAPNNIYAVGYRGLVYKNTGCNVNGVIYHYDGKSFKKVYENSGCSYYDIWGSSSTNIYAVGELDGSYYNGITWNNVPDASTIYDLHGTSSDNIYGVSPDWGNARIYYYNGLIWKKIEDPSIKNFDFNGLWVLGKNNVIFGTQTSKSFHYDGNQFKEVSIDNPNFKGFNDMWGTSSTNIYAVGGSPFNPTSGSVLHYNGQSWKTIYTQSDYIYAISGVSDTEFYTHDHEGNVHHHNYVCNQE